MVQERIHRFNQENAPFYLVDHDGKNFSLCLALSFLPDEYEDFGQAAFNRYAEKIGEPIMERGLYTHGNGYEWEDVFKKFFESDPNLSKIRFDCEAGGFFCNADDLSALEVMGRRFREVCMDAPKFADITVTALQEAAVREEQERETWYAFRLKINKYELLPDEDSEQKAQWISLPVHPQEAKNIAKSLGAKQIEGCLYYEMESTIPQITADHYPNMRQFSKLNRLAEMMLDMSPDDQVKFKAVLDLERPADMDGILDCAIHLDDYHMEERLDDEQSYFQEYLSRMLPPEFDRGWLDSLICASEGHALLKKLDGKVTEYGVIAGRNRSLYEMVPCRDDLIIHPGISKYQKQSW